MVCIPDRTCIDGICCVLRADIAFTVSTRRTASKNKTANKIERVCFVLAGLFACLLRGCSVVLRLTYCSCIVDN